MKVIRMKKIFILIILFLIFLANAENIKIYTEVSPPINFKDKNGELVGVSVEIVKEIQRRLGSKEKIRCSPWARGYHELQKCDNVILFSTARTKKRENLFKWVGPITRTGWIFYGKKESKIKLSSLDDAKKLKQISTVRNDARENLLKEKGFKNLHSVTNNNMAAKMVDAGRSDAFVSSNLGYRKVLQTAKLNPNSFEELIVLRTIDLYIAFSKKIDDSIVEKWQKSLDEMKKDGTFEKIYHKWLPGEKIPMKAL